MMLLALALLQAVPAPPVTKADDVVVIGEQLKTWRASWRTRDGKTICTTTRSSGDIAIDAIGCGALTDCGATFAPRAIAIAKDRTLTAAARRANSSKLNSDLGQCMMKRRDALIVELADKRAAARDAGS